MSRLMRLTSPAVNRSAAYSASMRGNILISLLTALAILSVGVLLSGCSSVVRYEQPAMSAFLPIDSGTSLGQTFLARYDGLQGIAIYLNQDTPGEGEIHLTLYDDPLGDGEIFTASLPAGKVDRPAYYRFSFPPLDGSAREDYYLRLKSKNGESYQVAIAPGRSYLNGAAYQNDKPLEDAQLAFRLFYDPRLVAQGLLRDVVWWAGLLAAGFAFFILPGWAILAWLYPKWGSLRWPEKLGLASGLSLAIFPLIYLYTSLVGLRLGALYAWLPPIIAAAYLLIRSLQRSGGKIHLQTPSVADLAYLVLTLLVFASRFWAVRTLPIPMWGDSYHHTLVAQLLVNNNGLFNSWAPYAEMRTFTYHFGFHTLVSGLHYLTGLEMPAATLWTGQLVNGLAVICLYPLATRLGRSPWAGVIAVLVAGLLSPMPMHYANWGRYTQLAGQVILIAAVYLVWDTLNDNRGGWQLPILSSVAMAGLALTHLRVVIIAVLFLVAWWLIYFRRDRAISIIRRTAIIVAVSGLLFMPWLVRVFSGRILNILSATLTAPVDQAAAGITFGETVGDIFAYLPALIWLFIPVIIGWGLWRRERGVLLVALWWWLVWIAGEPTWYGLPGKGAITAFAVLMAAYIPAALFFGAGAGWAMESLRTRSAQEIKSAADPALPASKKKSLRWYRFVNPMLALAVIAIGVWGARLRLSDVDIPKHALVLSPDLRAYQWIKENLPPESRFLVNAHLAFYETASVGTDGGWWLPLLAGRQTTIPPINYSFEQEPWPGYRDWINTLYKEIESKGIDHPDVVQELRNRGVSHVYIGQQQGNVSFFGQFNFDMDALQSSPHFRQVYSQDRVRIFEVLSE